MKVAILAAMNEELSPFINYYKPTFLFERGKTKVFQSTLTHDNDLFLVETGIGKANAAASASIICEAYQPDIIINTGSCGGFSEKGKIGDVVISTSMQYADVDATAFGYSLGQVPQMPAGYELDEKWISVFDNLPISSDYKFYFGQTVTTDSFMSEKTLVENIKTSFPDILASDMECTSIAQIAHFYNYPVLNIRAISDIAGQDAADSFDDNIDSISLNAFETVKKYIELILQ